MCIRVRFRITNQSASKLFSLKPEELCAKWVEILTDQNSLLTSVAISISYQLCAGINAKSQRQRRM